MYKDLSGEFEERERLDCQGKIADVAFRHILASDERSKNALSNGHDYTAHEESKLALKWVWAWQQMVCSEE